LFNDSAIFDVIFVLPGVLMPAVEVAMAVCILGDLASRLMPCGLLVTTVMGEDLSKAAAAVVNDGFCGVVIKLGGWCCFMIEADVELLDEHDDVDAEEGL
jgi:hypothetical protein